jgi:hypothetical protein
VDFGFRASTCLASRSCGCCQHQLSRWCIASTLFTSCSGLCTYDVSAHSAHVSAFFVASACCCTKTLGSFHCADGRRLTWLTLEAAIVALIDGLPAAARAGDAALILHARRLTTALQARAAHGTQPCCHSDHHTAFQCGAETQLPATIVWLVFARGPLSSHLAVYAQAAPATVVVTAILANPARRTALLSAFCTALDFDRAAAPLLLHAGASDAGPRAIEPMQSSG